LVDLCCGVVLRLVCVLPRYYQARVGRVPHQRAISRNPPEAEPNASMASHANTRNESKSALSDVKPDVLLTVSGSAQKQQQARATVQQQQLLAPSAASKSSTVVSASNVPFANAPTSFPFGKAPLPSISSAPPGTTANKPPHPESATRPHGVWVAGSAAPVSNRPAAKVILPPKATDVARPSDKPLTAVNSVSDLRSAASDDQQSETETENQPTSSAMEESTNTAVREAEPGFVL
jgi:hypothetical protein